MQRCAILDASSGAGPFERWMEALAGGLSARGANVTRFALCDLRISQCRGCFRCWVRTPGRCDIRDDAEQIVRAYVASDVLVLASPIVMGFTTSLLRRAVERCLPTLHPYFEVVNGEIHHRPRYSRRPRLALVHDGAGLDAEDEELLELLHRRMALNMRTTLALVASTERPPTEICDALARL